MRILRLILPALFLITASCASTPTPRERYISALNYRMAGNTRAYHDTLMRLALDAPKSRAGRRARASLGGGSMLTTVGALGVLSAVAIPSFMKFQSRAKQSEAKAVLMGLALAQASFYAENQRYCESFSECGVDSVQGAKNYLIFLTPSELAGATGEKNKMQLLADAAEAMALLNIEPGVSAQGFLAVAVGNIDKDSTLDVWVVSDNNSIPMNVQDDSEQ
ncbi:hypothetical protein KAI87_00755 [Myxococcota bacterium]|nr:hypothetical protein [Myxococcota bacterium]